MMASRGMGAMSPNKMPKGKKTARRDDTDFTQFKKGGEVKSPAWQRAEGKNPEGGLNAKGRASAKAQGMNLKAPQPEGGKRRDSFCSRMTGMKSKLTSEKTAKDPDSRINKSLRAWKC
jgi:hypothetical protein